MIRYSRGYRKNLSRGGGGDNKQRRGPLFSVGLGHSLERLSTEGAIFEPQRKCRSFGSIVIRSRGDSNKIAPVWQVRKERFGAASRRG